jgi:hypothetical protein
MNDFLLQLRGILQGQRTTLVELRWAAVHADRGCRQETNGWRRCLRVLAGPELHAQ